MSDAKTEPRDITPVSFYREAPYSVAGNMVKKDFGTRVEKIEDNDDADGDVTPEADDGGTDTDDGTTPPTDATTGEGDTVTVEDVDAPALNGTDDTDDDDDTLEL